MAGYNELHRRSPSLGLVIHLSEVVELDTAQFNLSHCEEELQCQIS